MQRIHAVWGVTWVGPEDAVGTAQWVPEWVGESQATKGVTWEDPQSQSGWVRIHAAWGITWAGRPGARLAQLPC